MPIRRLVFISYQHSEQARANVLARRIKWLFLGMVRVFHSDPEKLFNYPIEELASRLSKSNVVIQLVPAPGPTRWLIAEREFSEHLAIPVIQTNSSRLGPLAGRILRAVLAQQRFARHSNYLLETVVGTSDPEPPTPVREIVAFTAALLLALVLAIHLRVAAVFGLAAWVVFEIHAHRVERVYDDLHDLVAAWRSGIERAFREVSEYGEHLRKIDDEHEWIGRSSTPVESFQPARKWIGRACVILVFLVTLVVDVVRMVVF